MEIRIIATKKNLGYKMVNSTVNSIKDEANKEKFSPLLELMLDDIKNGEKTKSKEEIKYVQQRY